MIKIESIKRWCGTLLSNSKGQIAILQYEFFVSSVCVCVVFALSFHQCCMTRHRESRWAKRFTGKDWYTSVWFYKGSLQAGDR